MLNKIALSTDSQLSNEQLANSLLVQALEQLTTLSGLSQHEAESLLMSQFSSSAERPHHSRTPSINYQKLVSEPESQYIAKLFN